jgi:hypothetical protein
VTKDDLLKKLADLSDEEFARISPFIEADLESSEDLALLQREVEAGRHSAKTEPLLEANDVYTRVRDALSK